jgi:dephospho-CoA kinase
MIVLGLTGSIAMGKSVTAGMFAQLGIPVFDADAAVHRLYAAGGKAVAPVGRAFSGVVRDGAVDRRLLTQYLSRDPDGFIRLEAIVHPLVKSEQQDFRNSARAAGHPLVVLDIPLLFEAGRAGDVDHNVVVTAPPDIQRQRVLARPGMTEQKFAAILARQMPDEEKRRRADFLVDTGKGEEAAFAQVRQIVDHLLASKDPHKHA